MDLLLENDSGEMETHRLTAGHERAHPPRAQASIHRDRGHRSLRGVIAGDRRRGANRGRLWTGRHLGSVSRVSPSSPPFPQADVDNRTGFRRRGHGYLADQARSALGITGEVRVLADIPLPMVHTAFGLAVAAAEVAAAARDGRAQSQRRSGRGTGDPHRAHPGRLRLPDLPLGLEAGPGGHRAPDGGRAVLRDTARDRGPPAPDPDRRWGHRRCRDRRGAASRRSACPGQGGLVHPADPGRLGNRGPGPGPARRRLTDPADPPAPRARCSPSRSW